ncbi:MAG: hypothetical protein P8188_03100 [Gemmatimonadota bacterium]
MERRIPLREVERVDAYGTNVSGTVQVALISATVLGVWFFIRLFSGPGTY